MSTANFSIEQLRSAPEVIWPERLQANGVFPVNYLYPFSLNLPKEALLALFQIGLTMERKNSGLGFDTEGASEDDILRAAEDMLAHMGDDERQGNMVSLQKNAGMGVLALGPNTPKILVPGQFPGITGGADAELAGFPLRIASRTWSSETESPLPAIARIQQAFSGPYQDTVNNLFANAQQAASAVMADPERHFGRRNFCVTPVELRETYGVENQGSLAVLHLNANTSWSINRGGDFALIPGATQSVSAHLETIPDPQMSHQGLAGLAEMLNQIPDHNQPAQ
jgi:hypothetical protein